MLKGFKILSFNIRSLPSKLHQFTLELIGADLDIICLNETWLKATRPSNLISIDGYSVLRQDRCDINSEHLRSGGGVCAYIKNSINACRLMQFCISNPDIEILTIELSQLECRTLIIINLYRPPTGNCQCALDKLSEICNELSCVTKRFDLLIVGDINIDTLKETPNTRLLAEFCGEFGLHSNVSIPTRESIDTSSCIDVVLSNMCHIDNSGIITSSLSDHYPLFLVKKKSKIKYRKTSFTGRSYRDFDSELFGERLCRHNWGRF